MQSKINSINKLLLGLLDKSALWGCSTAKYDLLEALDEFRKIRDSNAVSFTTKGNKPTNLDDKAVERWTNKDFFAYYARKVEEKFPSFNMPQPNKIEHKFTKHLSNAIEFIGSMFGDENARDLYKAYIDWLFTTRIISGMPEPYALTSNKLMLKFANKFAQVASDLSVKKPDIAPALDVNKKHNKDNWQL